VLPVPTFTKKEAPVNTQQYELTPVSFPKAIVYRATGDILAHPTPFGEPGVMAFQSVQQAADFVALLVRSGKLPQPGRVIAVDVPGWIDLAGTLLDGGIQYVAIVVGDQGDDKMAVVPLVELLKAARDFTAAPDEPLWGSDQSS
jgi:hypothetical protein